MLGICNHRHSFSLGIYVISLSLVSRYSHTTQSVSLSQLVELNFPSILFTFSFLAYSNPNAIRFLRYFIAACMFGFSFLVSNKRNWSGPTYITVSVVFSSV